MPDYVVELVAEALIQATLPERRQILASASRTSGSATPGVAGARGPRPARERGAELAYADPYVPSIVVGGHPEGRGAEDQELGAADCVLILTDHPEFEYRRVVKVGPWSSTRDIATWGIAAPAGRSSAVDSDEPSSTESRDFAPAAFSDFPSSIVV